MGNEDTLVLEERTARRDETAAPAAPARPQEERRLAAWIGKSVIFKGDLISSEELTIDGRVEGTIEVHGHGLTIGPGADVRADIVAHRLNVQGAVTGSITAKEKVDIAATGSVEGAILCPRLAMADGAVVRGQVEVGPRHGRAPDPRLDTI